MVFEAFVVLPNGSPLNFQYPTELGNMAGSVFSSSFNLNQLTPIKCGLSAGSVGIDFYDNGVKKISCAIQIRSDVNPNYLDVDCFTRSFLSGGTLNPRDHTPYREAIFHNLPYGSVSDGLIIGFRNSGSEVRQTLSPEEINRLFERD